MRGRREGQRQGDRNGGRTEVQESNLRAGPEDATVLLEDRKGPKQGTQVPLEAAQLKDMVLPRSLGKAASPETLCC